MHLGVHALSIGSQAMLGTNLQHAGHAVAVLHLALNVKGQAEVLALHPGNALQLGGHAALCGQVLGGCAAKQKHQVSKQ